MDFELRPNTRDQILAQVDAMSDEDRAQVSPVWLAAVHAARDDDPWMFGYTIVELAAGDSAIINVVGHCGFKSAPSDDGAVEIAYGVSPEHQGRGIATWAAGALTRRAFADDRVQMVIAHTLSNTSASARVLTKNGFRSVGVVTDPEDGDVWRWEHTGIGRRERG